MAKDKSTEVKAVTTVKTSDGLVLNAPPVSIAKTPPPKAELLSFENYCALKNVPVLHQAGMRAFTQVRLASLVEWQRIFKSY